MTGGMAGIAGTVLVLYATILQSLIPDVAGHLIVASVLGAPAAILVSELMVPETKKRKTQGALDDPDLPATSTMDAITNGTTDGLALLLNIVAMLLVLVALVHLANAILSVIPNIAGAPVTLQRVLGVIMAPVCWLMGIPWSEAVTAGSLMGIKTVLNEFIAYIELSKLPAGRLSDRSRLIMLYAMCGFANFALARDHDRGAHHHGAAAPRGNRVARPEDHRVRHARDHGDRRDHRGVELTRPLSSPLQAAIQFCFGGPCAPAARCPAFAQVGLGRLA